MKYNSSLKSSNKKKVRGQWACKNEKVDEMLFFPCDLYFAFAAGKYSTTFSFSTNIYKKLFNSIFFKENIYKQKH